MDKLMKLVTIGNSFIRTKFRHFDSRKQLEDWQQKRLRAFEKRVLTKSPFYRQYQGQPPSNYPVINKAIHMANFNAINTCGLHKDRVMDIASLAETTRDFSPRIGDISVGLSSGTSGNRGVFIASDAERLEWAATIVAKMLPAPWEKHRIGFFLRANNNLYETVSSGRISFQFYDLLNPLDDHTALLNLQNPTVLIAPAQVLRLIAEHPSVTITPKRIISVAEVLDDSDKAIIEKRFKQTVHQVYQCTEGFLASTCQYGNLHLNEDIVFIEKDWIDKATGRFSPIITDFRRVSQPMVRYRLDDVLIENPEPCPCGQHFTRIEKVEGRCDDILYLPNSSNTLLPVFPDFICRTLAGTSSKIADFNVQQISAEKINIQIHPDNSTLRKKVTKALNELFIQLNINKPAYEYGKYQERDLCNKRRRVQRMFSV